jgi:hypothetical protein
LCSISDQICAACLQFRRPCTGNKIPQRRHEKYIYLGGNEILTIGLLTSLYEWVNRGVRNMVTALKIEIVSIAAAFAFMTGVLAAVW